MPIVTVSQAMLGAKLDAMMPVHMITLPANTTGGAVYF